MNRKTKGYRCMRKSRKSERDREKERGWLHSSGIEGAKRKRGKKGVLCAGAWQRGIKQPHHRIVKDKVLLLRPPTDSNLELIRFKGELFGHLQRHVLLFGGDRRRLPLFTTCRVLGLRKGCATEFTGQSSLISFQRSRVSHCRCIGLSNLVSERRELLDCLALTLSLGENGRVDSVALGRSLISRDDTFVG